MQLLSLIRQRFEVALDGWVPDFSQYCQLITSARDPVHGDYQANIAMPLKNVLGKPPRNIAVEIVGRLKIDDICEPPEVAGPGFINLRLKDSFLAQQLMLAARDERIGIGHVGTARTFVIDYSSPNVAKPLHVGHLRTTVIGDSLARILRILGHKVITDNHLGDWGTQFGMIIYGYKHFVDASAYDRDPVAELSRLYRVVQSVIGYQQSVAKIPLAEKKLEEAIAKVAASQNAPGLDAKQKAKETTAAQKAVRACQESLEELHAKVDPVNKSPELLAIAEKHADMERLCQNETVKLHQDDAQNIGLWNQFMPIAIREIDSIYTRLDIAFDHTYGESFYHPMLGRIVDELVEKKVAVESEGAICIFLDGYDAPMLIRKRDGAFLYATTDLATIQFRVENFHPDAILYVVDFRQSEHFQKLFAAARAIGYGQLELNHISYGTVMGPDGKPYKTRSGNTVGLDPLLDEAIDRAYQVVCDPERLKKANLEMPEEEKRNIARVVGLGAIKYADLFHNRTSDYEFNTEKMVALDGNTSAYIQYMFARTQSIMGRSDLKISLDTVDQFAISIEHDAERGLALTLLQFEDALVQAAADYFPNILASYVYNLARQFAVFFEHCPVLIAETDGARRSRLAMCFVTGRVLQKGLELLGIGVVPRM